MDAILSAKTISILREDTYIKYTLLEELVDKTD